jgi:hypothetical protein
MPTPRPGDWSHVCGTPEQFANGLTFNPDITPVVYRADGLPVCCGVMEPCSFILCRQEEVNGQPASQWTHFVTDPLTALSDQPAFERVVAEAIPTGGGPYPGYEESFYLLRGLGKRSFREWDYSVAGLLPIEHGREWEQTPDIGFRETISQALTRWEQRVDGVLTQLDLRISGTRGELTGYNLTISDDILPPYTPAPTFAELAPEVP